MNVFSLPITQGSVFGSNGTTVFAVPSSSIASSSTVRYDVTNPNHKMFGTAGSTNQNSFAPSTYRTTFPSFPTQGSIFGGSSTGVIGAQLSFSPASSSSSWTQWSPFGRSSIGEFGASSPVSSASSPSVTGKSLFAGSSTGALGAPLAPFSSAQGSLFGGSRLDVLEALPSASSSASSSFLAQGSLFAPFAFPSSPPKFGFGQVTAGSALIFGTSSPGNTCSTTSRGPFGGAPSTPWFGVESTGARRSTMTAGFTNCKSSIQPTFKGLGRKPDNLYSTSHNTGRIIWGLEKGSRIKSYQCTTIQDGQQRVKHMSISSMSTYASKSHEELRWEDYKLKSEGQQIPINNRIQEANEQSLNVLSATSKPLIPVSTMNVNIKSNSSFNHSRQTPLPILPLFDTKKVMLNVSSSVLPQHPISPGTVALQSPQLHTHSSGLAISFPAESPSVGSGCLEVNPLTSLPIWNDGNMPPDFSQHQPSVPPLQCSVTGKVSDNIIAIKDPFGSETVTFQPSLGV